METAPDTISAKRTGVLFAPLCSLSARGEDGSVGAPGAMAPELGTAQRA
jgi:hypothetical protein